MTATRHALALAPRRILAALLAAAMTATMLAAFAYGNEFRSLSLPFKDRTGILQSLSSGISADQHTAFFATALGKNGQSCGTCHQPDQGLSVDPSHIKKTFVQTQGLDPLFRPNDTADRPDAGTASLQARRDAYKLFLELGIIRIGKTFKGNADPNDPATSQSDFRVEPQDTPEFGPLPNAHDPQHPGIASLSLFRRPLVNSNVAFDSAVLWDGRDKIDALPSSQVPKAVQSLLLGPGSDAVANRRVADFMTGVFTDQTYDNQAKDLAADGARGGAQNLLAMSSDPARPCLYAAAFPQIPGMPTPGTPTLTPFTPITCTRIADGNPHTFGVDLFDAWATPSNGKLAKRVLAARAAIVRGQTLFNTVVLHQPADLDGKLLDVGSLANGGARFRSTRQDRRRRTDTLRHLPRRPQSRQQSQSQFHRQNWHRLHRYTYGPGTKAGVTGSSAHKHIGESQKAAALLPASEKRSRVF